MSGHALALYVHWPFCVRKCPYCDFNSHVRPEVDAERYGRALLTELHHEARLLGRRPLASIFFGGGTPSLMPPAVAAAVIEAATGYFDAAPDIEITLEANPSSVEASRFRDFAAAGVNRVSLGIQALDDSALKFLGRPHDLGEGLAALDLAQRHFPRVSFDLIHSRPGQSVADWEAELRRALSFGTGHLSAYQLTIEAGTRFHTLYREKRLVLPDEADAAAMFELTGELCAAANLLPYEISNHARPGEESRHNLAYWTYADYAGIGPGAHGRRQKVATERHRRPESWMAAVERDGHGLSAETPVPPETAAGEALMMGLRLADGINADIFHQRTGVPLDAAVDGDAVRRYRELGLLLPGPGLAVSPQGRGVLDRLVMEIFQPLPSGS